MPAPERTVEVEVDWPKPSEHRLREIAEQLEADGFSAAAAAYRGRIEPAARADRAAQCASRHLRDLDRASARVARENQDEIDGDVGADYSGERGTALATWLVQQGWTPPSSLPGLVVREGGE